MYFTISTYFLAECGLVAAYQNFVQNQPTPPLQRTTFLCLSLVTVRSTNLDGKGFSYRRGGRRKIEIVKQG